MDSNVPVSFDSDAPDQPSSWRPRVVRVQDRRVADFGSFGVHFLIWAEDTGGRFSLVEHPIPPRTLVAPLHRHANEDEYSLVLDGCMGARLGDDTVVAERGDIVFKPRGQWHTFWNAGDTPCRVLEIISPGGFEHLFREMSEDPEAMVGETAIALDGRYGLEVDYDSVGWLCETYDLEFPVGDD
jgi:mannose-6-phosphate isomerase-like protein (cupin superfamily)